MLEAKKFLLLIPLLFIIAGCSQQSGEENNLGALRVLTVPSGGTGASTFTVGECLVGNGTDALTTQACGGAASFSSNWQELSLNVLTPTNTSAGIFVNASSTIDGDLTVIGDGLIQGNATSTHLSASEFCLSNDCISVWPTGSTGGTWATDTEQYFWNNTSTWSGFYGQANTWEATQTARTADDLSDNTTADLAENTNLYYTDNRVRDFIQASSTIQTHFTNADAAYLWGNHALVGYLTEANWDTLTNKPATSTILALLDSDYRISELHATTSEIDTLSVKSATSTVVVDAPQYCISGSNCISAWPSDSGLTDINSSQLGQLADVSTTTIAIADILMWTGANWINQATSSFVMATEFNGLADTWESGQTARTADDISNDNIETLANVDTTGVATGNILMWNGASWIDQATSSILMATEIDTFAELQALVADKTLVNEEDIFTIDANWVNTANPWADNEVADTLTVTGYMQDEDINTFAELNSWVTDATLLKSGGTLTSGKICRYDGAGIDCDYDDQTGGIADINSSQLGQLADVSTTTIAIADILMWDGVNWINQATTSILMADELNTFTELDALVADATLLKSGGTLTDTKYCTWDDADGGIDCNSEGGAVGGGDFAWTETTWGQTTSTVMGFLGGYLSTASSTVIGTFRVDGNATTTGHLAALDGNSDQWNAAYAGLHNAVTVTGEDYLTLSGQQITMVAINPDNLASADFGDFSCNGTTCTLDVDYITEAELDTISELNTQITDATILVSGGTLTSGNLCVADGTGGAVDCNVASTYYVQDGCSDCLNATEIEDIYLLDGSSDTMTGTLTADGLTLGANENITLGAQTLDHDGTDFVFSDSISVAGSATSTSISVNGNFKVSSTGAATSTSMVIGADGSAMAGCIVMRTDGNDGDWYYGTLTAGVLSFSTTDCTGAATSTLIIGQ